MSEDVHQAVSDKEEAGYVSEIMGISVQGDGDDKEQVNGISLLLQIGGKLYRFDIRKCTADETWSDSYDLLSSITDSQHCRFHNIQNLVHEAGDEIVHLLDEIRLTH